MQQKQISPLPDEQIEDGLPTPQRYYAALAIWLAVAMSVLDGAIVNIALPTIATELHASPAVSIWVINTYQLAITVLLLPLAALGDRIGYSRVYLPALLLFVAGSLACAMSGTLASLIVARMFQGIGAAGIMSINAALVRAIYPARTLGRGMSYNAVVLSVSVAVGPTLASFILSVAKWPWLFAINVPLGLAALLIGLRCLPHAKGHGREPDYPAAMLSAGMLGLVIFGGESFARTLSGSALVLLLCGIGLGILLVRREWRKPAPLFPLDLLRIPVFRLSIMTSTLSFAAQMMALVTMPFLLQGMLGRSIVESGLLLTPWPLAIGCMAPFVGRLADRYPAGILGGIGLALFSIGLFSLSFIDPQSPTLAIVWRMALCGVGFGMFQSPNNRAMISAAPWDRSGAAGGMLATARLLGQTVGAVAVASGFHWFGLEVSPLLLRFAAAAAAIGIVISLLRTRVPSPYGGKPVSSIMDV